MAKKHGGCRQLKSIIRSGRVTVDSQVGCVFGTSFLRAGDVSQITVIRYELVQFDLIWFDFLWFVS